MLADTVESTCVLCFLASLLSVQNIMLQIGFTVPHCLPFLGKVRQVLSLKACEINAIFCEYALILG